MADRQVQRPPQAAPPPPPPLPPPPARPPVDPALPRRAARLAARFGLLSLAAVLTASLPLPWGLAAFAFLVAALVVGVLALVAAVRARLRPPPVVVLSFGLAVVGALLLVQLARVLVYPATQAYEDCRSSAITSQAAAACDQEMRGRLLDQLIGG